MPDMLLVLDLDHLAARTTARKLRSARICCKIVPENTDAAQILAEAPLGLILAGGRNGCSALDRALLSLPMPILALSGAAGRLCECLGGQAEAPQTVDALSGIRYKECPLLIGLEDGPRMLGSVSALTLPENGLTIAETADEIVYAFSDAAGTRLGIQTDIEPNDPDGMQILMNFALNVCGCTEWWDEEAFVKGTVDEIRKAVQDGTAICAMTGGLNSGVSALLAHKALGDRLRCVFMDTGLLRDGEADAFMAFYQGERGLNITRIDAKEQFLSALRGVIDPTEKRTVIGGLFHQILSAEQEKTEGLAALIKGTSYSDVMQSSHSAQGQSALTRIEPVRDLFKDEIRKIGEYLGLPAGIISSQPFPGSGLALRILGEANEKNLRVLRRADRIFSEEIAASPQNKRLWQHFAVLSPNAMGNGDVICLRAVHAADGAPAHASRLPYDLLEAVTDRILRECPEVQRVVYDLTPSFHYAGIEWQ